MDPKVICVLYKEQIWTERQTCIKGRQCEDAGGAASASQETLEAAL